MVFVHSNLNSFINPNYSADYFGFSMYIIMSSTNNDYFISSFLICMTFISFSWLITLAIASITILNNTGNNKHPYLFPHLKEWKSHYFSIKYKDGIVDVLYQNKRSSIQSLMRVFYITWIGAKFFKGFFYIYWGHLKIILPFCC